MKTEKRHWRCVALALLFVLLLLFTVVNLILYCFYLYLTLPPDKPDKWGWTPRGQATQAHDGVLGLSITFGVLLVIAVVWTLLEIQF